MMKVFYTVGDEIKERDILKNFPDAIFLGCDNWDDYNFKTTFPASWIYKNRNIKMGSVKIFTPNFKNSHEALNSLLENGWDGEFPIPNISYVSVPESLLFYEQLESRVGLEETLKVAMTLHDASYLVRLKNDPEAIELTKSDGFKSSLLRETQAIRAFYEGWKLFGKKNNYNRKSYF